MPTSREEFGPTDIPLSLAKRLKRIGADLSDPHLRDAIIETLVWFQKERPFYLLRRPHHRLWELERQEREHPILFPIWRELQFVGMIAAFAAAFYLLTSVFPPALDAAHELLRHFDGSIGILQLAFPAALAQDTAHPAVQAFDQFRPLISLSIYAVLIVAFIFHTVIGYFGENEKRSAHSRSLSNTLATFLIGAASGRIL